MNGTNLGTTALNATYNPWLADSNGYGILVTAPSAGAVTTAGFQIGCLLLEMTAGVLYINTGNVTTPTWTKVGTQS
jgi:hypothetical protein